MGRRDVLAGRADDVARQPIVQKGDSLLGARRRSKRIASWSSPRAKGFAPLTQTFVAGAEWKEYAFPFSAFGGIDGHDLMAVIFAGGPTPGPFSFRIDDIRFR